ncbi:MAG: hypothetical protein IH947_12825 [Bacteroidetes bacterium]|nr:hypothetical protein [Bacteroidota bacterium]
MSNNRMGKLYDHNNRKLKLEDINKDNIFSVPEGYFDELPAIIQSRVSESTSPEARIRLFIPARNWQTALIAATMTLLVVIFAIFRLQKTVATTPEDILAQVDVEDIIKYLDYSDFTTEEILAVLNPVSADLEEFIEDDTRLLNDEELKSIDLLDLYETYGIDEENLF